MVVVTGLCPTPDKGTMFKKKWEKKGKCDPSASNFKFMAFY